VVVKEIACEIEHLTLQGVADIIVDPGFGFGKTVKQNLEILGRLSDLAILGRPLLVGISRKSMLCKPLGLTPETALNATTAANTIALLQGASILRVHDVAEAVETVKIIRLATVTD
ncbi:MAG: dihydropteroate synthase, partial [Muribaculaceae bacterium]|nr:dihydropteroate synthase [Muribaculaceae bacterium]